MDNYCKNCGAAINEDAKFCPDCGASVEKKKKTNLNLDNKNMLIIAALVIIIAALSVGILFSMDLFDSEVPLVEHDFGGITMPVPKGSDFVVLNSMPAFQNIDGFFYLKNNGNYSKEVGVFGMSTTASVPSGVSHFKSDDDVQIFKDDVIEDSYFLAKKDGDYYIYLMGSDYKTMVKMLKSAQITDKNLLKSQSSSSLSSSSSSSQTTTPQTPATTSMSILGGTFSTGSSLSDKTYASIYVGSNHAGEKVKIQIYYSRDGSNLNNGNMVPKTVDSSGYINVRSADAYSQYPDYATINLYDNSGNLMDSTSVTLTPDSGTQSF